MSIAARVRALAGGIRQPALYLIAGGLNTLFGIASYPALLWLFPIFERYYLAALPVAQALAICFAYLSYKLIVFRTRGNAVQEFGLFSSFYLAIFIINLIALPLMVEGLGLTPALAQTGFAVVTVLSSYLWHSRITFRRTRP